MSKPTKKTSVKKSSYNNSNSNGTDDEETIPRKAKADVDKGVSKSSKFNSGWFTIEI